MKSPFVKDLVAILTSRVTVILFGLGASIVTARYLGPVGNGIISAIMVYPSLFMTIGSLGIRQSTTYYVGQEKYDLKEIYSSAICIWIFTTAFCLLSCLLLITYSTKGHYSPLLIFLAVIAIPFSLYNTYASGIFLGKQDIKEFNRINWVPAVGNFLFTFLFVIIFPFGVPGSMVGTFLGVFFLTFFVAKKIRKSIPLQLKFNWAIIKGMLSLGVVYAISLLVINLNYKVDIIILERLSTPYELGIYSKGVSIIQYMWEIPMVLSTLIFSKSAASKDSDGFSIKVCRLLRISCVVILIASVIIYFLSGVIIYVLYGTKFQESAMVLKLLMPGILLLTIFKVLNMDIAGRGKPWLSMVAMVPAVILNIVLNYLWIPKYGANGSALASTVSYSFSAIVFLFVYSSAVKIPVWQIFRFSKEDFKILFAQLNGIRSKLAVKNVS